MGMEIKQYKRLKKNEAYIGTVITDFAYAHLRRAYKPRNEGEVIKGVDIFGEALSTEIFQFLKKIDNQWNILNSNVTPIPDFVPEKVEKLLKNIKELEENLE